MICKQTDMKKWIQYIITGLLSAAMFLTQPLRAQDAKPGPSADTTIIELQTNRSLMIDPGPLPEIKKTVSITGTSSVSGQTLYKTPVANITNTLYGYLPGLTVKQGSGEPGYDDATLHIRGRGNFENDKMVIYVDGFQTTPSFFSYMSASEIESISVLKDPVSLATFGMKGANGVLWVVTKRGFAGRRKVDRKSVV
jgi:TonB-dependent SusC/RagA subfamily outer membrane receptor